MLKKINIAAVHAQIFKIWRVKRMKLFLDLIQPESGDLLLDVGGTPETWLSQPQYVKRIDCLNIYDDGWTEQPGSKHCIQTMLGDGCALEFEDGSYEVLFSNSVIEHVGDWEKQLAFASEARRVGKKLWVQTPAYECPIEPHFLAPFVHWLPIPLRTFCVRWLTPWAWLTHPGKEEVERLVQFTRLITRRQMEQLFPDCRIITERLFLVFPKSYIACRTPP